MNKEVQDCTVVDLFAGVGGLTHGFLEEGFNVAAGIDADAACRYPYEKGNPGASFVHSKIEDISADYIRNLYPEGNVKILAGCAPCQPFSSYTRQEGKHESWQLLYSFGNLINEIQPEIVTMENVPRLKSFDDGTVFDDFINILKRNGYHITWNARVYAPNYGVPQNRYRLIVLASKWGNVKMLRPSRKAGDYRTVRDAIGHLEPIFAGEISKNDTVHRTMALKGMNLERIRASVPGGTWEDWTADLRSPCHSKESGQSYKNVYGRMSWDEPSPTITTQCYGFGNGRFGHPQQDRAISMREAALLQTFPPNYEFFDHENDEASISKMAMLIGNAVPVALARMIAKSIRLHILHHRTKGLHGTD